MPRFSLSLPPVPLSPLHSRAARRGSPPRTARVARTRERTHSDCPGRRSRQPTPPPRWPRETSPPLQRYKGMHDWVCRFVSSRGTAHWPGRGSRTGGAPSRPRPPPATPRPQPPLPPLLSLELLDAVVFAGGNFVCTTEPQASACLWNLAAGLIVSKIRGRLFWWIRCHPRGERTDYWENCKRGRGRETRAHNILHLPRLDCPTTLSKLLSSGGRVGG